MPGAIARAAAGNREPESRHQDYRATQDWEMKVIDVAGGPLPDMAQLRNIR